MHVVIIREVTGELNVIGPFWDVQAARLFVSNKLDEHSNWNIAAVTDRDKF